eukprot:TRINITY_DN862_c0_g1_i1.p1 TRINITY_DN862_c0_g1~~TRINITY_DN862_c0_g1_i1.p1  ORF type:complete len:241 (-),score=24.32 TRINITY_DN862_c0_g1_i1:28-750(-)
MGTSEGQPGEPAVGIPYGPSSLAYQTQAGGYNIPPAGVHYSQHDGFPGQVDTYLPPHMSHSAPPPGYPTFHPGDQGFAPQGADGDLAPQFHGQVPPVPANYITPVTALTVYNAPPSPQHPMHRNPFQAGFVPPNAIYVSPMGFRLRDTFFGDTPAPFECQFCMQSGLTIVRSERSVASYVACIMSACIGVCFLFPSCDCLWHKFHYCPNCHQKVGDFTKADACLVVDPAQWTRPSFGVPV